MVLRASDAGFGVMLPSFDSCRLGHPFKLLPGARLAEELKFDTARRGARLDESLEVGDALLRGLPVDHTGPEVTARSPAWLRCRRRILH